MATATATPTTLQGHDHEFQYLKEEDRSQFTNTTNDVTPSDILAQLSEAELNSQTLVARNASNATPVPSEKTPNQALVTPPREAPTPILANTYQDNALVPPPAPMKQKDEFQYYDPTDAENESVEISHLLAQQEQAPPSPIPYIPEDYVHIEEGPIEEPFDCVPVDDSAEGILKQLEKVVHKSDRVLHPDHYDGKGHRLMNEMEMAMMTPKRSGDPMKSPANSDCGSTIGTGTLTLGSRASVSIKGINKKPVQPIMKLRVNDSVFEPLTSVVNEQEEMPFDETTSHNFKTALRSMLPFMSPNGTPDTTMMEDSETDDDTTNYGDEDEWTADTSKYTDDDTATSAYTMDTPMDEEPSSKKSRKKLRRKQLLARARAVDKKTKEQAGWDELLLDAVFSPDVTETALDVADYLQSGAEVTISMTKGMLQDAVTQLEKEEKELNGIPEGDEEEEDTTDAGEAAYRNIAAAATGSNLNENEVAEQEEPEEDTNTQATTNENESKVVKDPWDQESFKKEDTTFADLMQKGLPLMNRKLARVIHEWTKTNEEEEGKVEDRASTTAAEEENVVEPMVPGESEVAETEPIETPAATEAETTEAEEKKESEDNDDEDKPVVEKEESPETPMMENLELEDAQDALAAEEASTMSLEKPTKRLSV